MFQINCSYDAPNGQTGKAAGIFIHGGPTEDFQTEEVEVFQVSETIR